MDPEAAPIYCKVRTVPYALRELELGRLQKNGIITPVELFHWATPIVPVVKRMGP